nr:MAG TPA: hypothetical protein [Caudoviricetes sp.]DAY66579.1 MAG TPA: hypothetical protein [Caudoviricetes sp.]
MFGVIFDTRVGILKDQHHVHEVKAVFFDIGIVFSRIPLK